MLLVIIGDKSASKIRDVIKGVYDNLDIMVYNGLESFVVESQVRTLTVDRLLLLQDGLNLSDKSLSKKLVNFNNYFCDTYPAAKLISISRDKDVLIMLNNVFKSPYMLHLLMSKAKPKVFLDIVNEDISKIKDKYGSILVTVETEEDNDMVIDDTEDSELILEDLGDSSSDSTNVDINNDTDKNKKNKKKGLFSFWGKSNKKREKKKKGNTSIKTSISYGVTSGQGVEEFTEEEKEEIKISDDITLDSDVIDDTIESREVEEDDFSNLIFVDVDGKSSKFGGEASEDLNVHNEIKAETNASNKLNKKDNRNNINDKSNSSNNISNKSSGFGSTPINITVNVQDNVGQDGNISTSGNRLRMSNQKNAKKIEDSSKIEEDLGIIEDFEDVIVEDIISKEDSNNIEDFEDMGVSGKPQELDIEKDVEIINETSNIKDSKINNNCDTNLEDARDKNSDESKSTSENNILDNIDYEFFGDGDFGLGTSEGKKSKEKSEKNKIVSKSKDKSIECGLEITKDSIEDLKLHYELNKHKNIKTTKRVNTSLLSEIEKLELEKGIMDNSNISESTNDLEEVLEDNEVLSDIDEVIKVYEDNNVIVKEVEKVVERVVEKTVERPVYIETGVKSKKGVKFIIVTGDRRTGRTRTALNLCKEYALRGSTLFVDLDIDRRGSISYLGLEDIACQETHVLNGVGNLRSIKVLKNITYKYKSGFDCLISLYDNTLDIDNLKNVQSVLSIQSDYNVVVIDCDLEYLVYLEDILLFSNIIICTESNLSGVINTVNLLISNFEDEKYGNLVYNNGYYAISSKNIDDFSTNMAYVEDIFDLDSSKLNWAELSVLGSIVDIKGLAGRF